MEYKITWFLTFFALVIIYIISNGLKYELTAKQYVINTYLYILLALIVCGTVWMSIEEYDMISIRSRSFGWYNTMNFIALVIVSFASLFGVLVTSNDQQLLKHTAWTTFIVSIGILTYIHYKIAIDNKILETVLIELLTVVAILSFIAYTQPLHIFDNWLNPMMCILLSLIVIEIIDVIFFSDRSKEFVSRTKIYSWVGLFLFSGFLMYRTQKIVLNGIKAEKCGAMCADYPKESLSLFLNIANLFQDLTNIN